MPALRRFFLASTAVLAGAQPALPAQLTRNFEVRVTIQTGCTVTATALNFGNVGIITGTQTAISSVNVACSLGTPYTLSFNSASLVSNYNGQMSDGANQVNYFAALSGAGGIGPGIHTINGLIPAQATPPAGVYTDTRTVYVGY